MSWIPAVDGRDPDLAPPPLATFDTTPRRLLIPRWMMLASLIIAQALLARYMTQIPRLGQLQAAVIVGLIVYGTLKRDTILMVCVAAYIPGAEIVWRQAQVAVPYLTAPYLLTAIAVLCLVTSYQAINTAGRTALLYIAFLLPSAMITFTVAHDNARKLVAFALSGPAALAFLVTLFSQITIRPWLYRRLLWVMLISGVGALSIALTAISDYIVNVGDLQFDTESNFITSGGFGPVQVSALMGLTVLVAILLLYAESDIATKILAASIGLWSAVQSLLTFSRGGMFATAIAVAGLVLIHARTRAGRRRAFVLVGSILLVGYYVVVPQLDSFTRGNFEKRFSSTETGRTELAHSDVEIFLDHPVFGVGPGMSKYRRLPYEICELRADKCNLEGSSHTEFTRTVAEHGAVGLIALAMLASLAYQAVRRAGESLAVTVTMLLWAVAQMFYANLRIAAVPFAFAFSFFLIRPADPVEAEDPGVDDADVLYDS